MKTLLESKVRIPDWDSLSNLGDFRILPDDSDEEIQVSRTTVQMSSTTVHPAAYDTYHPQQGPDLIEPRRPSPLSSAKVPGHLRSQFVQNEGRPSPRAIPRRQVPGASPNSVDSQQTHRRQESSPRTASVSSGHPDERQPTDSPTLGNHPSVSRSSGSHTSSPIESMQFGVPPLQAPRPRPGASPPPTNGFATRPLPPINTRPFSSVINPQSSAIPRGNHQSPISPTSAWSQVNEPVEHGVRPGETEIMGDEFRGMYESPPPEL